jgi:hypothetical protein
MFVNSRLIVTHIEEVKSCNIFIIDRADNRQLRVHAFVDSAQTKIKFSDLIPDTTEMKLLDPNLTKLKFWVRIRQKQTF